MEEKKELDDDYGILKVIVESIKSWETFNTDFSRLLLKIGNLVDSISYNESNKTRIRKKYGESEINFEAIGHLEKIISNEIYDKIAKNDVNELKDDISKLKSVLEIIINQSKTDAGESKLSKLYQFTEKYYSHIVLEEINNLLCHCEYLDFSCKDDTYVFAQVFSVIGESAKTLIKYKEFDKPRLENQQKIHDLTENSVFMGFKKLTKIRDTMSHKFEYLIFANKFDTSALNEVVKTLREITKTNSDTNLREINFKFCNAQNLFEEKISDIFKYINEKTNSDKSFLEIYSKIIAEMEYSELIIKKYQCNYISETRTTLIIKQVFIVVANFFSTLYKLSKNETSMKISHILRDCVQTVRKCRNETAHNLNSDLSQLISVVSNNFFVAKTHLKALYTIKENKFDNKKDIGFSLKRLGLYDKVIETFKSILIGIDSDNEPDNFDLKFEIEIELAEMYMYNNQYQKAIDLYEIYLIPRDFPNIHNQNTEVKQKYSTLLTNNAVCLFNIGQFDKAERFCNEAMSLFWNDSTMLVLANIYWCQGNTEKALRKVDNLRPRDIHLDIWFQITVITFILDSTIEEYIEITEKCINKLKSFLKENERKLKFIDNDRYLIWELVCIRLDLNITIRVITDSETTHDKYNASYLSDLGKQFVVTRNKCLNSMKDNDEIIMICLGLCEAHCKLHAGNNITHINEAQKYFVEATRIYNDPSWNTNVLNLKVKKKYSHVKNILSTSQCYFNNFK